MGGRGKVGWGIVSDVDVEEMDDSEFVVWGRVVMGVEVDVDVVGEGKGDIRSVRVGGGRVKGIGIVGVGEE